MPASNRVAKRELPLRIVDQPGGTIIRCLCGRELASMRRGSASEALKRPEGRNSYEARSIARLSPDITAHGLAIMIAHALTCKHGG